MSLTLHGQRCDIAKMNDTNRPCVSFFALASIELCQVQCREGCFHQAGDLGGPKHQMKREGVTAAVMIQGGGTRFVSFGRRTSPDDWNELRKLFRTLSLQFEDEVQRQPSPHLS